MEEARGEEKTFKVPENFLWGAATSAYQIEGYPLADGAAPSIWHEFSHRRGRIKDGQTGEIACDHYHRYLEDVRHMEELGLGAYRFSVAWPRIVPAPGKVNPKGLDFYQRLVDALLARGIEPFITIFHWETPLWLESRGGFVERESADRLADYGEVLFRALGDRVRHWITLNEPMVYATYGYFFGHHAPGKRWKLRQCLTVTHHLLLGHSLLVRRFRQIVPGGKIGIAQHQVWTQAANPGDPGHVQAADTMDQVINRMYLDPILLGRYPEKVTRRLARFLPGDYRDDMENLKAPPDFIGLNYYTSWTVRPALFVPLLRARHVPTPGAARSAMWEVAPEGMYWLLLRLKEEYGNPEVYITENGFPLPERPGRNCLEDRERIDYLRDHIGAALRAMREGVNLRGFFVWTLLDNFEWQHGYEMRFGLIRVDFRSLERTWRRSAGWYRNLIREAGAARGG